MIKFFRQSYAIQYVVIALMAIALWIPAFLSGTATQGLQGPATPLFNLVDRLLSHSSILQHLVAFLLLIVEMLIFNAILVKSQIVGKVSTMGAFIFLLLMSLTPTQTNFYPFILSALFILFSLGNMFEIYQHPNPELCLLKSGIFVALASLCYFQSIWLVIWAIIVIPMAKKGSIRLQLIPLIGFFFVYFIFFVGVYLFGDFKALMQCYLSAFTSIHFSVECFNLENIILLSLLIVPTLFLYFGSNDANFEKSVSVRVKLSMTVVLFVFAVLFLFMGGDVLMNGLIFIVLSVVISYVFSYMGNTGWANLFMVVFLLLVFANHYYFKLL